MGDKGDENTLFVFVTSDSSQNLQRGRKLQDCCNSCEGKRLPQSVLSGEKTQLERVLDTKQ